MRLRRCFLGSLRDGPFFFVVGIQPGDRVADVGAGDGDWAERLADKVGPAGHVYATEIEADSKSRAFPMAVYPMSWTYYLSFIFIVAFVFLNMMIGIVLETLQREHEAYDKEHGEGMAACCTHRHHCTSSNCAIQ